MCPSCSGLVLGNYVPFWWGGRQLCAILVGVVGRQLCAFILTG
jgi:hypothetical protein